MHFELLLQNIEKHISLNEAEKEQVVSFFKLKKLKKKQFLLHEGDIQKQAAFVTGGCLRSYSLTKTGLNMYFNLPRQVGGSAIYEAISGSNRVFYL
jgi:CRP-like cAMP-binding protein